MGTSVLIGVIILLFLFLVWLGYTTLSMRTSVDSTTKKSLTDNDTVRRIKAEVFVETYRGKKDNKED